MRRVLYVCIIFIGFLVLLSPLSLGIEEPEIVTLLIGFKTTGPEMTTQGEGLTRELYSLLQTLPYFSPLSRLEMEGELKRAGISQEEILENPRREYQLRGDIILLGELEREILYYHLYYPKKNTWQSASIPWEGQRKAITHFNNLLTNLLPQESIRSREKMMVTLPLSQHPLLVPGQTLYVTREYHQIYTHRHAQFFPDGEVVIGVIHIRGIDEERIGAMIIREDHPIRVGDRVGFPLDITTLGGLTLRTNPLGSRIYLGDCYLGVSPLTLENIPARMYTLTFTLDGYEKTDKSFTVKEGSITSGRVDLTPLPGQIKVTSNRRADVYIGDTKLGTTPWEGELPPGHYTIEVRAPGYPTVRRSFYCHSNREYRLFIPIYGRPGSLYVTTNPTGASVYYKGRRIGVTPFYWKDQEPGFYHLEIHKEGYERIEEEILIYSGEENRLHLFLEEAPGLFTFLTTPERANIYYEGRLKGLSPLTLELPRGVHHITIEKEGFATERIEVESYPEKREEVHTYLQQLYGTLHILSEPVGAEVYRGNEFLGITPLLLQDHKAGRFTFTLKLGDRTTNREVFIPPHETETLFVEIREESPLGGFILASYDRDIGLFGVEVGLSAGKRHQFELELTHLLSGKTGGYGTSYTEIWGRYQYSFFEGVGFYVGYQMILHPVESTGYSTGLALRLLDGRLGGRLGPYLREDTTGLLWEAWYRGWVESRINPMLKVGSRPQRDFFFSIGIGF